MRHIGWIMIAAALCTPARAQSGALDARLGDKIAALIADPAVARAHWGVIVTTLDGRKLFGLNEAQFFQPASNAKLFTTAAAMSLLGPEKTFETGIQGNLDPATGVVSGDLLLKGGGDPNFDSGDLPYVPPANRPKNSAHVPNPLRDLNDLVDQLVDKGVKSINGDIVGDDTLFAWEPYASDWTIDDAVWGYGAPVSALTIADNQLHLSMSPASSAGGCGAIVLEQAVPYYKLDGCVATVATRAEATGMQVLRTPGSRVLRILGSMAVGDPADVEDVAIEDPAEYAAMALKAALIDRGIAVSGVARAKHLLPWDATGFLTSVRRPGAENVYVNGGNLAGSCSSTPPKPELAKHVSAPLAEDVIFTNKESQNLHAEILLRQLGNVPMLCNWSSIAKGAKLQRAFLLRAGVDPGDFVFYDGSGLSGHDLVTPRATAKLLAFAASNPGRLGYGADSPWFAAWKSSLPIGGVDGSLAHRFTEAPLKGHVFAKTGTLGEARALSGYLDCASGKTVIFSIMDSTHAPGSADRAVMDKIVAAIAAAE